MDLRRRSDNAVHMAVVDHRSEWNQVVISTMQGIYPVVVTAQDESTLLAQQYKLLLPNDRIYACIYIGNAEFK